MDKKTIKIQLLPFELNQIIRSCYNSLPQKCYENCGIITLLARGDNYFAMHCREKGLEITYCLGLLTDCNSEVHPHAWIKIEQNNHWFYCDPTLQNNSTIWQAKKEEFNYDLFHELTPHDIVQFFKNHYSEREFNDFGIPYGHSQFPIIDVSGKLLCAKDIEQC